VVAAEYRAGAPSGMWNICLDLDRCVDVCAGRHRAAIVRFSPKAGVQERNSVLPVPRQEIPGAGTYEHRDIPEQARQCLASFEQSVLATIQGQSTDDAWFAGRSAPHILRVGCDLLWLLTRAVGSDFYIQHSFEG
jgi:hypothetical protein